MNKDEMKGKWQQAKGTIKEKAGKLVGSESLKQEGKRDMLQGKMKEHIAKNKERNEDR